MSCPECDIFPEGTNKHSICCGKSRLPEWKVDRYRQRWGLPPLHGVEQPSLIQTDKKVSVINHNRSVDNLYIGDGPGSQLLNIYSEAGIPACEACNDLAKKMNQWGIQGCEERIEEIVDDVLPRAKQWMAENKPWIHTLLPNIVEDVGIKTKITADIKKAIKLAKNPPARKPPVKRRGGCGSCGRR